MTVNITPRYGFSLMIVLWLLAGAAWAQTNVSVVTAAGINEAFGVPLWADGNLWETDIDEVARRLDARLESQAGIESSYLVRPNRILGVKPEVMKLLGKDGKVSAVMIMFANKGDTLGMKPRKDDMSSLDYQQALKEFNEREQKLFKTIKIQGDQLESALKNLLGVFSQKWFGEGDQTREWVKTWTWKDHVIMLAENKGVSLSLRIVPPAVAKSRGKAEKISDAELRAQLKMRVLRRNNGDVIVTGIPMISQGNKGYCVPATWARFLRYMGIPADEYVLANAGQTLKGGGTSVDQILAATTALANQNRRSIRKLCNQVTISTVAGYVDDGLPLMWKMYSIGPFEGCGRSSDRMDGQSPEEWKKALKPERKAAKKLQPDPSSRHMCMIIGYNARTDEIATSDSWGLEHAEKWYTLEEVQAVSAGELYLIAW